MLRLLKYLLELYDNMVDENNEEKLLQNKKIEEFTTNELFLNFNFQKNIDYLKNLTSSKDLKQMKIEWELFNHGKKWNKEKINNLEEQCLKGSSIIELLVQSGRNQESLFKKLSELGWQFEKEAEEIFLVQYKHNPKKPPSDDKNLVINKIPYFSTSFYTAELCFQKTWFDSLLQLRFPYSLPNINKKDLQIEFYLNDVRQLVSVNDDLRTYDLFSGYKEIFNSKIKLSNDILGEIELHTPPPGNIKISLIVNLIEILNKY